MSLENPERPTTLDYLQLLLALFYQDQITSLVKTATPRQLRLLRALVVDLLLSEVVGPDSALAALVGLEGIGSLSALVPTLPSTSAESLSLLLASSSDKVQALNSALQLITSTKPNQVPNPFILRTNQFFIHLTFR